MPTVSNVPSARPADFFGRLLGLFHGLNAAMDALQPAAALLARGYVAEAFFKSGLTKLRDWDITLALFQDEYKVPLLPPEVAAVMGTCGELVLPVLLLLALTVPERGEGIWFIVFMASIMSRVWPSRTCWPTAMKGCASGAGDR